MLASHLQLKEFYASHSQYPKVVAHMRKNWAALAGHWAWFGRVSILDLEANTNNLVERFFGLLKYVFLVRNTQCTAQELVDVLLCKVVPSFMQMRSQHQAGRVTSSSRCNGCSAGWRSWYPAGQWQQWRRAASQGSPVCHGTVAL